MYDSTFPKKYPVTTILALLNILVFIAVSVSEHFGSGQLLYEGCLYTPAVLDGHEYYRILSAVFLHFGAEHLGSNMLALLALGPYVENAYGKGRYVFIYLFSGAAGNLLTMSAETVSGSPALSAGASGAVCGLLGVFFVFALAGDSGLRRAFPVRRVLMAAILMLIPGLTDPSVNFIAHIGGLLGGFISGWVLRRRRSRVQGGEQ